MTDYEIKDSGSRRSFSTGSVRDAATGKGRYDLISPIALLRLALHYEGGAVKYDDRNWEKGQPLCSYLDCGIRHLQKFLAGHRDEDHLAAAAWNIFAVIHTEDQIKRGALPEELNDLPDFVSTVEEEDEPDVLVVGCRVRVNDTCSIGELRGQTGLLTAIHNDSSVAAVIDGERGDTYFNYSSLDLIS